MNDHNLDDLIIDTIAPKNNKTKSLLTIVALLIVVLIVAIILTKTLLKSPDDAALSFEENVSEIIAPELKLQEPLEVSKPKDEVSLPTIIEETIPELDESKKPGESEEVSTPTVTETTPEPEKAPVEKAKEPVTETEEVISKQEVEKSEVKKPVVQKPVTPKVTTKPKTEVEKPVTKPTATQTVPKAVASGKYYVQVGSFKENPSPRFLSVIRSSGFKYHVTSPDRTGYKKLLIGPYKTRADVDNARDIVRDRIHKSAFVVEK